MEKNKAFEMFWDIVLMNNPKLKDGVQVLNENQLKQWSKRVFEAGQETEKLK